MKRQMKRQEYLGFTNYATGSLVLMIEHDATQWGLVVARVKELLEKDWPSLDETTRRIFDSRNEWAALTLADDLKAKVEASCIPEVVNAQVWGANGFLSYTLKQTGLAEINFREIGEHWVTRYCEGYEVQG